MNKSELEQRTKQFALKIIGFVATLPKTKAGDVMAEHLIKAGTSVGSHYRQANRAESPNDFIRGIGIVEKEAADSQYWLELCEDAKLGATELRRMLLQEVGELLTIFKQSVRTA